LSLHNEKPKLICALITLQQLKRVCFLTKEV